MPVATNIELDVETKTNITVMLMDAMNVATMELIKIFMKPNVKLSHPERVIEYGW